MSLVFNMVGGGGGISENRAVLVVRVPAGSTVTATKGGITLTPKMWVVESDPTQDIALFVIPPSLFDSVNPWTVTATDGTYDVSDTIIIDSNKQYDLELNFLVPAGYQAVEYLQSSGSQFISLTDFIANGNTEFEITFLTTNGIGTSNYGTMFGARSSYHSNVYQYSTYSTNTGSKRGNFAYGSSADSPSAVEGIRYDGRIVTNTKMTTTFRNNTLISDMFSGSVSIPQTTFTSGAYMNVFALREGSSNSEYFKGNIYSLKFWDGSSDTLLYDLVPCYRKSDSVAGMWDKVSKTFFTNAGTGTFVVGADV